MRTHKREHKVDLTKSRTVWLQKGLYEEILHKIDVYREILFLRRSIVDTIVDFKQSDMFLAEIIYNKRSIRKSVYVLKLHMY